MPHTESLEGAEVELTFPFIPGAENATVRGAVQFAEKNSAIDVAGIKLIDRMPAGAKPASLVTAENYFDNAIRVPGFPRGADDGEWARGVASNADGRGWVQIEATTSTGRRIRQGYSGAPVYDEKLHGVTGIVVRADDWENERVAFMIPLQRVAPLWAGCLKDVLKAMSPYKGAEQFTETDTDIFFGRESLTKDLADELEHRRSICLVGRSGSGKSSLLRAGLVPELRRRGWRVVVIRGLGPDPFIAIAESFAPPGSPVATSWGWSSYSDRIADLGRALRRNGLLHELHAALVPDPGQRVLVAFDQFEEAVTLCPDDETRDQLLRRIAELVTGKKRDPHIRVVISARSDYLHRLDGNRNFARACLENRKEIGGLDAVSLRRAIELPAHQSGVPVDDALVGRMLNDLTPQTSSLLQLQFVLTELWNGQVGGRLCVASYDALGGVQGALAKRAESLFLDLTEEERRRTRRILFQLVQIGKDEIGTKRSMSADALLDGDWPVVEVLAENRIVAISCDSKGQRTAQIAHEGMIDAWPRLRDWVRDAVSELSEMDTQADAVIRRYFVSTTLRSLAPVGFDFALQESALASMARDLARTYRVRMDRESTRQIAEGMLTALPAAGIGTFGKWGWLGTGPFGYLTASACEAVSMGAFGMVVGEGWKKYFRLRYLGMGDPDVEQMQAIVQQLMRNRYWAWRRKIPGR
jgi:hypothetical protein